MHYLYINPLLAHLANMHKVEISNMADLQALAISQARMRRQGWLARQACVREAPVYYFTLIHRS